MAEPRHRKFPARGAGNFLLFVGRQPELSLLAAELERVHQGEPRVVLLSGPAGIGKTSLLRSFLAAKPAATLLRASGDEVESGIAMGGVRHLLRATGSEFEPSADPVAAGTELADRLHDMAAAGAAAVVLDDCHLLDRPSLEAVTVAIRRLDRSRVLWLLSATGQPAEVLPPGIERLVAAGRASSVELTGLLVRDLLDWCRLQDDAPLPRHTAQRLQQVTGGHPGRVSELVAEFGWSALRRWTGPLPAPRRARSRAAAAMAALPEDAAELVRAAAVLGDAADLATVAEVAATTDPAAAIDGAVAGGILAVTRLPGAEVRFADPMTRAAVYADLGVAQRARLHRAAADVTAGTEGLNHRLAAVVGADAAAADDAEAEASRLLDGNSPVAAARLLLAASRITPAADPRRNRALLAARLLLDHGDAAEAATVVETLPADGPAVAGLTGGVALALGNLPVAAEHLRTLARADATVLAVARLHLARREITAAVEVAGRGVEAGVPAASCSLALALAIKGELPAAKDAMNAAVAEHGTAGAAALAQGVIAFESGQLRDAAGLLSVARDRSAGAAVSDRLMALRYLAVCHYVMGNWAAATAAAAEALELASHTSHLGERAGLQAVIRLIAGTAGEPQRPSDANGGGDSVADPASTELLAWAELVAAETDPASQPHLAAEVAAGVPALGSVWPGWQAPYVEALTAAGPAADAESVLTVLLDNAGERAWLRAGLSCAQGSLAAATGSADAVAHFERAVASFDAMPAPLDAARARINLGRFLRRAGRREEAVPTLTLAAEACEKLGVGAWHEQARSELALCGLGRRSGKRGAELTPQEGAVAELAAQGLSSREIANRLTVSIKTVEYHLGNVYAKLDIRSRTQLAVRFRTEQ